MQNINSAKIRKLLTKYVDGQTSLEEERLLMGYFQFADIPDDLKEYQEEFVHYAHSRYQQPGDALEHSIDKLTSPGVEQNGYTIRKEFVQLAAAIALVLISFFAGYQLKQDGDVGKEVLSLKQEITDLKETTITLMLRQESAHEKIRALVLASQIQPMGEDLMASVIRTFYEDRNPLVRSTALDLLGTYAHTDPVKSILVDALYEQESLSIRLQLLRVINDLNEEDLNIKLKKMLQEQQFEPEIKEEMKAIFVNDSTIVI